MKLHLWIIRMLAFGLLASLIVVLTGRAIDQRLNENRAGSRQQHIGGIGTAVICTREAGKYVCREPRP